MKKAQLEAALHDIGRIASEATKHETTSASNGHETADSASNVACIIKRLPSRLSERAAQVSIRLNPVNAPLQEFFTVGTPPPDSPLALTLVTAKYWGPAQRVLSVSFMEATPADLRARIVSHFNAWSPWTSISFAETAGVGDVRVSRGPGGYWSYLGTDINLVPQNRQTMNLEAFTMDTPDSEFHRVVRHESGHTLGFAHEHMRQELVARIDPAKAYPYFLATQGWSKEMVDQQVLMSLDKASIYGTAADQDSIMCYQLPGTITYDGQPIRGGTDINATDSEFASLVYPKPPIAPGPVNHNTGDSDWEADEDVDVPL